MTDTFGLNLGECYTINNSNKKEFINQAVVYIPFENYRDFILHNQDYNLNFKNIIPYKVGSDLNIDFSRATFAVIKNGLFEIIFEPTKPIDTNTFNEFIYKSEKLLKSN